MGPSLAGSATAEDPDVTSVVFLAGVPRSGSTLCGRLLADLFEVQFCGELLHIDALCEPRELCGCGTPIEDCTYWQPCIRLLAGHDRFELREMIRRAAEHGDANALPHLRSLLRKVVETLWRERALPIVDSSKIPAIARSHQAGRSPAELHVLHVIRDPSAVIASVSTRPLERPEVVDSVARLRTFPAGAVADRWRRHNAEAARLRRIAASYHVIRLEDLVASPLRTIDAPAAAIGLQLRSEPEPVDHSLRGNPARFEPLHVDPDRVGRSGDVAFLRILRLRALARSQYGYPLLER